MEIQIFSKAMNKVVTLSEPKVFDLAAGVCGVIHEDYEDILYNQYPGLFEITPNIFKASSDYCALGVSIKNTETGKTYHAIGDLNSHDTFIHKGKNERTKDLYLNHPLSTCYGSVFDKAASLATGIPQKLLLVDYPELGPVFEEAKYNSISTIQATPQTETTDAVQDSDNQAANETTGNDEVPVSSENEAIETEPASQTEDQSSQDRATILSAFVFQAGKYKGKTLGQIEKENSGWFQYISKNTKPEYREAVEYGRLKGLIAS